MVRLLPQKDQGAHGSTFDQERKDTVGLHALLLQYLSTNWKRTEILQARSDKRLLVLKHPAGHRARSREGDTWPQASFSTVRFKDVEKQSIFFRAGENNPHAIERHHGLDGSRDRMEQGVSVQMRTHRLAYLQKRAQFGSPLSYGGFQLKIVVFQGASKPSIIEYYS